MPGYDYAGEDDVKQAASVEEAVRATVINYFSGQLGWSLEKCEERVEQELAREIPKSLFELKAERRGWSLDQAHLIDVGAGQGGGCT